MATPSKTLWWSENTEQDTRLDTSFEMTVQNKSLQPCDLNGFMDYLYYVERRAENLQFFLWYCDYVQRWSRLLPQQRKLAPVWGPAEAAEAVEEEAQAAAAAARANSTATLSAPIEPPRPTASVHGKQHMRHSRGPSASSNRSRRHLSIDTGSARSPYEERAGYYRPRSNSVASTATAASVSSMASVSSHISTSSRLAASIHQRSDNNKLTNILTILENLPETTEPASARQEWRLTLSLPGEGITSPRMVSPRSGGSPTDWQQQPYTLQPFREELGRVVRHYIAATGDRALPDLFPPERAACLRAAKHTTHPSALLPAFLAAESALRDQSFPDFLRNWCVANVEQKSPRMVLVQALATLVLMAGLALDMALIMTVGGRSTTTGTLAMGNSLPRLSCFVLWWPALTVLLAAWRNIDLVLYIHGERLLRPWERVDGEALVADSSSPMFTYSPDREKGLSGREPASTPAQRYQRGHRHQASTSSSSSRIDPLRKASLQSLGPQNDPDSEPWVSQQRQTPFHRRLMAELLPRRASSPGMPSRAVAIQHAGVRAMQTNAVWMSVLWAGLASAVLSLVSLFIPGPGL